MDTSEIQAAFDGVFDQAILFHGFADYMRDYDLAALELPHGSTTWLARWTIRRAWIPTVMCSTCAG